MLKVLAIWFLASYSYDNILKTYKVDSLTQFSDFVLNQQRREDTLREKCNLELYSIPPPPTLLERLLDTYHSYRYPPVYLTNALSYDEFMDYSYDVTYQGSTIVYDNQSYHLVRSGKRSEKSVGEIALHHSHHSHHSHSNDPLFVSPIWTLTIGSHSVTITNIK